MESAECATQSKVENAELTIKCEVEIAESTTNNKRGE